jgi:4-amino-4-deoxy-L-arabinose transferase-like glycosyltransferase
MTGRRTQGDVIGTLCPRDPGRPPWLALLLLALGVILARLPLIGDAIDARPDAGEYLGIARHLAEEGAWVSDIRWHFATREPVRHSALGDRPPLYPLLNAALFRVAAPALRTPERQIYAARLLNAVLSALVAVLGWLLIAAEFTPATAWISVLLFSLLPQNLRYTAQPLTEPLFMVLLVGALLCWRRTTIGAGALGARASLPARDRDPPSVSEGDPSLRSSPPSRPSAASVRWPFATGFLLGLAYLTHVTGVVLLAALCAWACLPVNRHGGWVRRLLYVIAGFAMTGLPYWVALTVQYGSPFYNALRLNFSVSHIHDAIYGGYERPLPTPLEFVTRQPAQVLRLVAHQAATVWGTLFSTLLPLLPLAVFLRRRDLAGERGLFLLLALALNLVHALAWVTWGAARYLLPCDLLLIPLLIYAPVARTRECTPNASEATVEESSPEPRAQHFGVRWSPLPSPRPTPLIALAGCILLSVALSGRLTLRLYREKGHPDRGFPDTAMKREAVAWLRANAAPGELVATDEPWLLNLLTGHPTVVFPWATDSEQAGRFVAEFRPGRVILVVSDPPGQREHESALLRRLFGERPVSGQTVRWGRSAWRIDVVRPGSRAGQWLLVLSPVAAATTGGGTG